MTDDNLEHKDWDVDHWSYLYDMPQGEAIFKKLPEDFIVTEQLGFELSGEGENLMLLIEKRQLNTQQVCEYLAKFFKKRLRDIGYAGLKDKQSISQQWFSVQLNRTAEIQLDNIETSEITVIKAIRHDKKLRVGALSANQFNIRLRDINTTDDLNAKLSVIAKHGVPNYFGPQRFGIKGNNLNWFQRMVNGESIRNKKLKGFALSAGRSYLFNQCVSQRIEIDQFDKVIEGDVFVLAGKNSYFCFDKNDTDYQQRLDTFDINISAPLYGGGESPAKQGSLDAEQEVAEKYSDWINTLSDNGLEHERRSIRLVPTDMSWRFTDNILDIQFSLPSGCFATSVLREVIKLKQVEAL